MSRKSIASLVAAGIGVILIIVLIVGGFGHNDAQNWQIKQTVGGKVTVRDAAGYYLKMFATVTTYPRYVDKTWNDLVDEGAKEKESTRTTFNDGGTAQISIYVKYVTPTDEKQRLEFHRQFAGNIDAATIAVRSHQINCVKVTGPLMSASENQSARKSEFNQLIEEQMTRGLYKMRRTEIDIPSEYDPQDPDGLLARKEKRIVTELILDKDGSPEIAKSSPLDNYGIKIMQLNVTGIEYDPEILQQFAAKKQSFLAAEQSKADREKEKQERLNIIERGLREVAEAEAAGNVLKETAVIAAQLKAEVAGQAKLEAETKAEMALSVAEIEKKEAQIRLDKADIDAQAVIVLAQAEQEKIRLAGAITELEQMTIDAKVLMNEQIAEAIKMIQSPYIVFSSGGEDSGQAMLSNLVQLKMLTDTGLMTQMGLDSGLVDRVYNRPEVLAPVPQE